MAASWGLSRLKSLLRNHFRPRIWCCCAVSARIWTVPEPFRNWVALRSAGYGGFLGRHVILTSPVLRPLRGNRFALIRLTDRGATR